VGVADVVDVEVQVRDAGPRPVEVLAMHGSVPVHRRCRLVQLEGGLPAVEMVDAVTRGDEGAEVTGERVLDARRAEHGLEEGARRVEVAHAELDVGAAVQQRDAHPTPRRAVGPN
jgi:hypothetical protein